MIQATTLAWKCYKTNKCCLCDFQDSKIRFLSFKILLKLRLLIEYNCCLIEYVSFEHNYFWNYIRWQNFEHFCLLSNLCTITSRFQHSHMLAECKFFGARSPPRQVRRCLHAPCLHKNLHFPNWLQFDSEKQWRKSQSKNNTRWKHSDFKFIATIPRTRR